MARKKSPSQKALARVADSAGGALALRDQILIEAGITNARLAQITKVIVEETLAAAQGAMRQQPVVVGTGRGTSEVQLVSMPDEALRQRCREALVDLIGLQPSRAAQPVAPQPVAIQINFVDRQTQAAQEPRGPASAKVVPVPGRPS